MKVIVTRTIALLFFLQIIVPPVSAADALPAPDVEPPSILIDESSTEIEAGGKTFTAIVTDNIGVAKVTLYFKGATDVAFTARRMVRSSTDPDTYTTTLYLDPVISNKLEIYVRADDISGNIVFKGEKFTPLAFTVVPKETNETVVRSVTEPAAKEEGMSTLTMILIGVGVLALAASGGGGGGSGGSDTGSVTVTTDVPN